jgi:hypothetical protein
MVMFLKRGERGRSRMPEEIESRRKKKSGSRPVMLDMRSPGSITTEVEILTSAAVPASLIFARPD